MRSEDQNISESEVVPVQEIKKRNLSKCSEMLIEVMQHSGY